MSLPQIVAVIPARLASTRLSRKVLREIAGRPMLEWVYRASRACEQLDRVLIATDSQEVMAFAKESGFEAMMTPAECASGTDRVHSVAQNVAADIYVNVQGDEPLVRPEQIDALLRPMLRLAEVLVSTVATACAPEQIGNPNAVKVVTASDGRALYFSRATIPHDRDDSGSVKYQKHLGLYAYRKSALTFSDPSGECAGSGRAAGASLVSSRPGSIFMSSRPNMTRSGWTPKKTVPR